MLIENLFVEIQKAAEPTTQARGGKYVRRWWTGERWDYEYADKPATAHGFGQVPELKGREKKVEIRGKEQTVVLQAPEAHTLQVVANDGVDPEKAYKAAIEKALSTVGTTAKLEHPHFDGELELEVKETREGTRFIELRDPKGKREKKFTSYGAYEKWYLGTSNTRTRNDVDGNPWLDTVPLVGSVVDGQLVPSTDVNRQFKITYNKSYPKEKQAEQKKYKLGNARTAELANTQIQQIYDDMAIAARSQDPDAKVEAPQTDLNDDDRAALDAAKNETLHAKKGTVAYDIQHGEHKWRFNHETLKRELDVSPKEREQLIAKAATDFAGIIASMAGRFVRGNPYFSNNPAKYKEAFAGDPSVNDPGEIQFLAPDPDSPTYRAISRALDTYDPSSGVGFAGYLAGQKGQLYWHMYREQDKLIGQEKLSGSDVIRMRPGNEDAEEGSRIADTAAADQQGAAQYGQYETKDFVEGTNKLLDAWEAKSPGHLPEHRERIRTILGNLPGMKAGDQEKTMAKLKQELLQMGIQDIVAKALWQRAIDAINMFKAVNVLTRDKDVDPSHSYQFRDGDDITGRYYYQDDKGNYVRYTNAPTGHEDRSSYAASPQLHSSEPQFAVNPEYFTPDGRKLSRKPGTTNLEWNANYNRHDPQNLWIGQWTSPKTGKAQYTYVDSDLRQFPRLRIHQQNMLLDARLPAFRQYIAGMFGTGKLKDEMTALAMALLDQGRLRAIEVCSLVPADVQIQGPMIRLGTRQIYADEKVRTAFEILLNQKAPDGPLFSVPMQKKDGSVDEALERRMGPHYLARVLDQQGLSLLGLQTYHASLRFSREMTRNLTQYGMPWEQAMQQALLVVAQEWGHDFTMEQNAPQALQLMQAVLIDPVVVEVLEQNAQAQQLGSLGYTQQLPPASVPMPYVSLDLMDRTPEEAEFSQWIHSHPLHDNVGEREEPESEPEMGKGIEGLFDLMKSKPTGVEGLFDLMKSAYQGKGRREGYPGHYKYVYVEPKGRLSRQYAEKTERAKQHPSELVRKLLSEGFVLKAEGLPENTSAHHKVDGKFTAERETVHQEIVDQFLDKATSVPDHEKPVAILTMGGPGSGKSTAAIASQTFDNFVMVEPDTIKTMLPEYKEAEDRKALNAATIVHVESTEVAVKVRDQALAQRKNVFIDGTGKNRAKMEKAISKLKEKGYHVQLIMTHIPLEEGLKRVASRAQETGRWVDDAAVKHAYTAVPNNFMPLAQMVDHSLLLDNQVPFGSPAKLAWSRPPEQVHEPSSFSKFQQSVGSA